MALIYCPFCGRKIFDSSRKCTNCGYESFECQGRGEMLNGDDEFCSECGKKIEVPQIQTAENASLDAAPHKEESEDEADAAAELSTDKNGKKIMYTASKYGPENDKSRPYRITFEYWSKKSFIARLGNLMPQKQYFFNVLRVIRIVSVALLLILSIFINPRITLLTYLIGSAFFLWWTWATDFFDSAFATLFSLMIKKRMKDTGGNLKFITESAFSCDYEDLEGLSRKLYLFRLKSLVNAGVYTDRSFMAALEFVMAVIRSIPWSVFRALVYLGLVALLISLLDYAAGVFAIAAILFLLTGVFEIFVFSVVDFFIRKAISNIKYDWVYENHMSHTVMYSNLKKIK